MSPAVKIVDTHDPVEQGNVIDDKRFEVWPVLSIATEGACDNAMVCVVVENLKGKEDRVFDITDEKYASSGKNDNDDNNDEARHLLPDCVAYEIAPSESENQDVDFDFKMIEKSAPLTALLDLDLSSTAKRQDVDSSTAKRQDVNSDDVAIDGERLQLHTMLQLTPTSQDGCKVLCLLVGVGFVFVGVGFDFFLGPKRKKRIQDPHKETDQSGNRLKLGTSGDARSSLLSPRSADANADDVDFVFEFADSVDKFCAKISEKDVAKSSILMRFRMKRRTPTRTYNFNSSSVELCWPFVAKLVAIVGEEGKEADENNAVFQNAQKR